MQVPYVGSGTTKIISRVYAFSICDHPKLDTVKKEKKVELWLVNECTRTYTKEGWKGLILPRKVTTPGRYKQVLKNEEKKETRALVELPGGNVPRFQVTVHRINVLSLELYLVPKRELQRGFV